MATKRLYRSESNRVIAGVCGGLGEYLDIDPLIIRIIFIAIFVAGGGGFLIYILMWLLVPTESAVIKTTDEAIAQGVGEMKDKVEDTAKKVKKAVNKKK